MKNIYKIVLSLLLTTLLASCNQSPEQQKADAEKAKGSAQQTAGQILNDDELKSEGKKNKLKGDLRSTKEDVKDAITNK